MNLLRSTPLHGISSHVITCKWVLLVFMRVHVNYKNAMLYILQGFSDSDCGIVLSKIDVLHKCNIERF